MIRLAGATAFQWSTSEQVYPLEKAADGSTLYAKEVDLGGLPNNGTSSTAHGIPSFNPSSQMHRLELQRSRSDTQDFVPVPDGAWAASSFYNTNSVSTTNIFVITTQNWTAFTGRARLIYKK